MTPGIDWIVHRYDTVASTMDEAVRLAAPARRKARSCGPFPQHAGRGRAGRAWDSPRGAALLTTLLLRPDAPPDRLGLLSLVAGVAVAEAIEAVGAGPSWLKWPNDVWLGGPTDGRKAAGILVVGRTRVDAVDFTLVGVGVDVATPAGALPPAAISLSDAAGTPIDADRLLDALLDRFARRYGEFAATRGRPSLADWRRRAALIGEAVAIEIGNAPRSGTLLGVDDDGALLLQGEAGETLRVVAGDLVRGPRRDPGGR